MASKELQRHIVPHKQQINWQKLSESNLCEFWKLVKGYSNQANTESRKRLLSLNRRALCHLNLPWPHFLIPSSAILKTTTCISGVDSWCQREQNGLCPQRITMVCFDLSGGSLKDWCKGLAPISPNSELLRQTGEYPGAICQKRLRASLLAAATWREK